jgi:hypothetical protein
MNTATVRKIIVLLLLCNPIILSAAAKKHSCKTRITEQAAITGIIFTAVCGFALISHLTDAVSHEDISFSNLQSRSYKKSHVSHVEPTFKGINPRWFKIGAASCEGNQRTDFQIPAKYLNSYNKGREYYCRGKAKPLSNSPLLQKTKR